MTSSVVLSSSRTGFYLDGYTRRMEGAPLSPPKNAQARRWYMTGVADAEADTWEK